MKPITSEKQQKLIDWIKEGLACSEEYGFSGNIQLCMEIALASLTAEPVGDVVQGETAALSAEYYGQVSPGDCLYTTPPLHVCGGGDYFDSLVSMARQRAEKAMVKFPQPNYVLNKVAEESGEVIKSVIHFTEGRETWDKCRK